MRIIIIGAGIIGAAIAHQLARTGADVLVMDAKGPASGATGASFGWINASFYLNEAHFQLRTEGIAAWHRLGLGDHVTWQGSLCWDEGDLPEQCNRLTAMGYAADLVDKARFQEMEPHVHAPEQALYFRTEGIAAPAETTATLLAHPRVRMMQGLQVVSLLTTGSTMRGVRTSAGDYEADRVIIAAGTGAPALLADIGHTLPLVPRPAVMMRTPPLPPTLAHVICAPGQELRQDGRGHLWAPTSPNHQSDTSVALSEAPEALADAAMHRVRALLGQDDIHWDRCMIGWRPMPEDGLPVIGQTGPEGLYLAVMHSGITLAAIVGELMSLQVMGAALSNAQADLLAPYGAERFSG